MNELEAQRGEVTCWGGTGLGNGNADLTLNILLFPPAQAGGSWPFVYRLAAKALSQLPSSKPCLVRALSFHLVSLQLALTSASSSLIGDHPLERASFLIHLHTLHTHSLPRARPRARQTQPRPQWLTTVRLKWPKSLWPNKTTFQKGA